MGVPSVTGAALTAAGMPGGTAALATGAAAAGAGALSNLIYNPASLKFILHGLSMSPTVPRSVTDRLATLPPQQRAIAVEDLVEKFPSVAQAVAQLGRAYAVQQQQGAQR